MHTLVECTPHITHDFVKVYTTSNNLRTVLDRVAEDYDNRRLALDGHNHAVIHPPFNLLASFVPPDIRLAQVPGARYNKEITLGLSVSIWTDQIVHRDTVSFRQMPGTHAGATQGKTGVTASRAPRSASEASITHHMSEHRLDDGVTFTILELEGEPLEMRAFCRYLFLADIYEQLVKEVDRALLGRGWNIPPQTRRDAATEAALSRSGEAPYFTEAQQDAIVRAYYSRAPGCTREEFVRNYRPEVSEPLLKKMITNYNKRRHVQPSKEQ